MSTKSPSVAIRTLGCKVNRVESEAIAAELLRRGASLGDEASAQVVVVSTCTVTGEADAKARQAVRHALRSDAEPIVVVTGCGAALDPAAFSAIDERVMVVADKSRVPEVLAGLVTLGSPPPGQPVRAGSGFRTRAMLKVQDGCDAFCAYCIVPYARGVPRAVPLEELTAESRALVAAGAREIVLTGINIGRYGDGDAGLVDVVEAVAASGVERLRLSSIEPLDLTPGLLGVLAKTEAFCPHLHVPLQSGCDAVLSAMGRRYTAEEYLRRIDAAREALPGLVVTTDVLCGFPGESDANAQATHEFCESVGFVGMHVFRYSARPGTRAATMPDQVAAASSAERAARLRDLAAAQRLAHEDQRLGTRADVLVETVDESGTARGTTPDYLRVQLDATDVAPGDRVRVRLSRGADGGLWGERVPAAC